MYTFTVKSATAKEETRKPHFFVLNKGMNSGKPLLQPCPNCFKIEAENEELKETLYWVSFALWKAKAFHPYLIGSVIPFIRIGDYKQAICEKMKVVEANKTEFFSAVEKLKFIDIKENQIKEHLRLIQELKRAYVLSYFNKHG
jgi:hypothetical protein